MNDYMRNRKGEESDSFFCRFTFGQFFALLVLEVFTLFFIFYLGARYGREFLGLDKTQVASSESMVSSDNNQETSEAKVLTTDDPQAAKMAQELIAKAQTPELKDRISKMFNDTGGERAANTPEVISVGPAGEAHTIENSGQPALAQHEISGSDSAAAQLQPQEQPKLSTATPVTAAANQATPDVSQAKLQEDNQASSRETAGDKGVIRVKSADNAKYSLQVGSYPKMDEATRSVESWKSRGYPAYMMIADIPDRGRWYRVRIGGFGSREDASRYLKEFESNENAQGLIVMNEQ